ncbi:MAG: dihydrodipicolinate reductase [Desulfobacterales bacterium]|jgi:4-hydroxy-tetrahydrodipicolinate reductase
METIPVMVNGLPGNMALTVARHVLADDRFELLPFSLTGPEIAEEQCDVDGFSVALVSPARRSQALADFAPRSPICVDFTHPSAVNENASFYCGNGLCFVMGTTGGDRKVLSDAVAGSSACAVIAPNMAKQIVGIQAMLQYAADSFPGLFTGYRLQVRESHQKGKADTSGTAKAVVGCFSRLGVDYSVDQIEKERDPEVQRRDWKIPEAYLSGHGWHTYTLTSADETVTVSLTHNINGREIYARGTLDAIAFLSGKIRSGEKGKVYSMVDVLKGG